MPVWLLSLFSNPLFQKIIAVLGIGLIIAVGVFYIEHTIGSLRGQVTALSDQNKTLTTAVSARDSQIAAMAADQANYQSRQGAIVDQLQNLNDQFSSSQLTKQRNISNLTPTIVKKSDGTIDIPTVQAQLNTNVTTFFNSVAQQSGVSNAKTH